MSTTFHILVYVSFVPLLGPYFLPLEMQAEAVKKYNLTKMRLAAFRACFSSNINKILIKTNYFVIV